MSDISGNLLWNRKRITLDAGDNDIDTKLQQASRAFAPGDPILGISGTTPPADGTLPASRVMVIPMAPTANWALVTHGEPWFDTTTGTVHVKMAFSGEVSVEINVLFWDPDTKIGPGLADTYNEEDRG